MVKIEKIVSYTIPQFDNKRVEPYGKLLVSDGVKSKIVDIKEGDKNNGYRQFFTFNRKRYYIENKGSLYNPEYRIVEGN